MSSSTSSSASLPFTRPDAKRMNMQHTPGSLILQARARSQLPFSRLVTSHWYDLVARLQADTNTTSVDGKRLTIAAVVHIARYGGTLDLHPSALPAIRRSASILRDAIKDGEIIYGVNTGFGGSADTRTSDVAGLQQALLRTLQAGILSNPPDTKNSNGSASSTHVTVLPLVPAWSNGDMPSSWVRAAMAIRINSLASGASGIDPSTLQVLIDLLTRDVIPQIPLRGSISASGDLSPLSYIAGAMQAQKGLLVYAGGKLMSAPEALNTRNIDPAILGPKEGLAIVNGTAFSAAVGSLVMHEALQLATLSQVLTAMSVEALAGADESFDAFIAGVRPHPGQVDAAKAIGGFLAGSRLTNGDQSTSHTLRQDRYSLRTSSQWIGPILEDLTLSFSQISTELNSVTDNPLIDSETGRHLHGGNFQALSVSVAMQKVRSSCQILGKMLFAQCTEMINPVYNRGLPPNLTQDEPSKSFMFKGVDIMMAALSSELGHLSAPVNHIETAEMGNQALNSLALISGRYTLEAIDVLSQMCAAHLAAACQAVDLRVIQIQWLEKIQPIFDQSIDDLMEKAADFRDSALLKAEAWAAFRDRLDALTTMDSVERITTAIRTMLPVFLDHKVQLSVSDISGMLTIFSNNASRLLAALSRQYSENPDASPYLGAASRRMYHFVRRTLNIPLISEAGLERTGEALGSSCISPIYAAIRNGALWPELVECLHGNEERNILEAPPRSRL